jgi:uncharacterized delta-60 repeat protein
MFTLTKLPNLGPNNFLMVRYLSIAALLLGSLTAVALGNGRLDTGFGNSGVTLIDFASVHPGNVDVAQTAAIQSDGKIIVAGYSYPPDQGEEVFALARINVDGTLDQTFGTGGRVLTDVAGFGDSAYAIAIQPDGKILLGGETTFATPQGVLVRYNPNGSLDANFGTGGILYTDIGFNSAIQSLVVQPDGKIIAGIKTEGRAALLRYLPNGQADNEFGLEGAVRCRSGITGDSVSLTLQGEKILVAGSVFIEGHNPILSRYNLPSGALDFRFGRYGREYSGLFPGLPFNDVIVQTDGKIVASGKRVVRYDANGRLDRVFDSPYFQELDITSVTEGLLGRIVVIGTAIQAPPHGEDLITVVFNSDGNVIGSVRTDLFGGDDLPRKVFVQPDGKIVVAGGTLTGTSTNHDFVVVRYSSITP